MNDILFKFTCKTIAESSIILQISYHLSILSQLDSKTLPLPPGLILSVFDLLRPHNLYVSFIFEL